MTLQFRKVQLPEQFLPHGRVGLTGGWINTSVVSHTLSMSVIPLQLTTASASLPSAFTQLQRFGVASISHATLSRGQLDISRSSPICYTLVQYRKVVWSSNCADRYTPTHACESQRAKHLNCEQCSLTLNTIEMERPSCD